VSDHPRFTVAAVVDVPVGAVTAFQRYEDVVLPLLARHDGVLERRLPTADGATEVHVLSFSSDAAYRGYLADPERLGYRSLLDGVPVQQRVVKGLVDVFLRRPPPGNQSGECPTVCADAQIPAPELRLSAHRRRYVALGAGQMTTPRSRR
jgi:hypothetical protein